MNKKNAFSYFMWFLYSMAVCIGLLGIAGILSRSAGYSIAVGYGVGGLWLILCGLIVFLLHKLVSNMSDVRESGRTPLLVAESLVVVILFALGIFLRVSGLSGAGEDAAYFELAKVTEGQVIPPVVHGAVYIYLQLLHLVYLIFGNKFIAGIILQIVLQMIAGFFLYRAVRKLAGVVASLVTLGFVMAGPMMVEEALSLSPEMLFLAVYAVALYVTVQCIRGRKTPVACLTTGVVIAVVCYLDILGISLLFMAVVGMIPERSEEDASPVGRLVGGLFSVLGCGAGFLLLMLIDSLASGKEWLSVITAWWNLYSPSAFVLPEMLRLNRPGMEFLVFVLIMGIGVFSFWCDFEKERQSIWIWLAVLLVALQSFGMTTTEVNGTLFLYIAFAILSGVSLSGIFAAVSEEEEFRSLGKILEQEEAAEAAELKKPARKAKAPVEEQAEENPAVEESREETTEKATVEALREEAAEQEKPPRVKFLENPLPLPKKHVKKVLDYDVELTEGQDDFDLAVDDNDDYDI